MTSFDIPPYKLAPRTPAQKCVYGISRSSKNTLNVVSQFPDRSSLTHRLAGFDHQQRQTRQTISLSELLKAFKVHNPN